MGIRIQPYEIEILEEDPLENDLLDRRTSVEVLTRLIGSIEGPCVLAVDAAWGAGKTTFLKIWSQYLRNKGFPVIEFNAWETDSSGDPFVALSSELMEGLERYKEGELDKKVGIAKKVTKEILQSTAPYALQLALDSVPGGKITGQLLASYAKNKFDAHQSAQQSIKKFKKALQDMAKELAEQKNHPLIVVIDELDRCRPTYAVELLEIAKHLFSVDKIIFVLAINRTQLAHSVQALYGSSFDGEGYLGRFFDLDFRLPEPDRNDFFNALLASKATSSEIGENVRSLLQVFLGRQDLSLRQIAQSLHRLELVLASLPKNNVRNIYTVAVLLIIRTFDVKLYYQFCQGDASDLDVSEAISAMLKGESFDVKTARLHFDATLILCGREIQDDHINWKLEESPLYMEYKKRADESSNTNSDHEYAKVVVHHFANQSRRYFYSAGFRHSVELLELLLPDLTFEQ